MNNITLFFAKHIRNIRLSKNISQEKLAELSGLHPTYIGQIERGEKCPTLESIYKISTGLNIKIVKLFENIDNITENEKDDFDTKIYNEIVCLSEDKKQKLYNIIKQIKDF